MKTDWKLAVGRRQFLRAAAAGAAVTAANPLTGRSLADTQSSAGRRKALYRETDHIKAYYRVNRYPAPKASK